MYQHFILIGRELIEDAEPSIRNYYYLTVHKLRPIWPGGLKQTRGLKSTVIHPFYTCTATNRRLLRN